jgi:hypothetical protein
MTSEEKTVADHARDLRQMAELTARHSQNWDNFEQIALKMLESAYDAGKRASADGLRTLG